METVELIKEKSRNLVLDLLPNVTNDCLLDDMDLFSLGLDSINAMSLVFSLQDEFGVQFQTNDINFDNFRALNNIVNLITSKKG